MTEPDFDLTRFMPYLLNQAAEASSLEFQQIYKRRYGMLRTEWRVLFHLGVFGSLTASEIGERANMHKTKISRAVQKLTERRFVVRARDDEDRRVEHLTLTTLGRVAYAELHDVARQYDAALTADLTHAEQETLRKVLIKLSRIRPAAFT